MGIISILRKIKHLGIRCKNRIVGFRFGELAPTAYLRGKMTIWNRKNLFVGEDVFIDEGARIMNTKARVIIKKKSGCAFGFTAITGGHVAIPGVWMKDITNEMKAEVDVNHEQDQDIIIGEDVWIGANVTLLHGVTVGRGSTVGAGSVVRSDIPPYAIATGNPARVVGFRFTPGVIVEHEEALYEESERIPEEVLTDNFNKYFVSRIKEIQAFLNT
jgi:acetyltransferase-like isoleucine patch superfamily enzyme